MVQDERLLNNPEDVLNREDMAYETTGTDTTYYLSSSQSIQSFNYSNYRAGQEEQFMDLDLDDLDLGFTIFPDAKSLDNDHNPSRLTCHPWMNARDPAQMGPDKANDRDWNQEFQDVMAKIRQLDADKLHDNFDQRLEAWTQLSELGNDFVHAATIYSKMIIEELSLRPSARTLKPIEIEGAGGVKYIINNLLFKFCIDPEVEDDLDGPQNMLRNKKKTNLYGGNDYLGAKVGSHELKALNWLIYKLEDFKEIHFPMYCLIDYRGQRILAMSKLPIVSSSWENSTLVVGSDNRGQSIQYEDEDVAQLLDKCGQTLNLSPINHTAGTGFKKNFTLRFPVDLETHRGTDNNLYLLDLARLLPPFPPRKVDYSLDNNSNNDSTLFNPEQGDSNDFAYQGNETESDCNTNNENHTTSNKDNSNNQNENNSNNQNENNSNNQNENNSNNQNENNSNNQNENNNNNQNESNNNKNQNDDHQQTNTSSLTQTKTKAFGDKFFPNSVLYFLFRPEFLQKCKKTLASDGFLKAFIPNNKQRIFENYKLKMAEKGMHESVIWEFAHHLSKKQKEFSKTDFGVSSQEALCVTNTEKAPPTSAAIDPNSSHLARKKKLFLLQDITADMHSWGINIRFLGEVRRVLLEIGEKDSHLHALLFVEMIARALKNKARHLFRDINSPGINQFKKVLVEQILNPTFGNSTESNDFWENEIRPLILTQFGVMTLTTFETKQNFKKLCLALSSQFLPELFEQVLRLTSLRLYKKVQQTYTPSMRVVRTPSALHLPTNETFTLTEPIDLSDVADLGVRVKTLSYFTYAQAAVLKMKALKLRETRGSEQASRLLDAALEKYKETVRSSPYNHFAIRNCAEIMSHKTEAQQEAHQLFQHSLAVNKDDPNTLYKYGLFNERLGKPIEAKGYYEQTLALNPRYFDCLMSLARLLVKLNFTKQALTYFTKAHTLTEAANPILEKIIKELENKGITADLFQIESVLSPDADLFTGLRKRHL